MRSSLEDRSVFITMVFEYLLRDDIVELPEGAVRYVVLLYGMEDQVKEKIFEEKSCLTPWGYEIDHGASVLAYEQRVDAPHICNLQRRTCKKVGPMPAPEKETRFLKLSSPTHVKRFDGD